MRWNLISRVFHHSSTSSRQGSAACRAEEGNALRHAVTEELARAGFDWAYVPTDRGRALEDLIDKLGHVAAVFD